MEHLAFGTIVLRADRTVAFVNDAARAVLGRTMTVRNGRIIASTPANQRLLDGLMASVTQADTGMSPSSILLSRVREGLAPLHIQGLPIGGDTSERLEMVGPGPGALLLLHDLGANSAHGIGRHLIQLGLTPGQARVAEAVGSGLTPREAAAKLGLSEATVRTVLKAVFDRLGVSRQSQLAVLVTRLSALP
jgi:DNA-binding CsgD family transcriptional regulator